jgi:O-antigen/teichoic acid export membrane protein
MEKNMIETPRRSYITRFTGNGAGKQLKNLTWVLSEQVAIRLINFITFAIVTRYAEAAEIGILGLAWTFLYFVEALTSHSMSVAVIQTPTFNQTERSTFFWICIGSSLLGTLAMVLIGSISWLGFHKPQLGFVSMFIGVIFMTRMWGTAHKTVLMREECQRELATNSLIASFFSAFLGIGLALSGFGIWALLCRNGMQSLIESGLNCLTRTWRPARQFDRIFARNTMRFAVPIASAQIGNLSVKLSQQAAISATMGLNVLGMFEVARRIPEMSLQLTSAVIVRFWFPYIAAKERKSKCTWILFKRVALVLVAGTISLVTIALIFRMQLVILIFGNQWNHAANIFCLLLLGFCVNTIQEIAKTSLFAKGFNRASVIQFYYNLCGLLAFLITLHTSSLMVALACIIAAQTICIIHLLTLLRRRSLRIL